MVLIAAGLSVMTLPALAQNTPDLGVSKPKQAPLEERAAKAVTVKLITETTSVAPGRVGTVGLSFRIAKGWHLYWRNSGDSGAPISWKFRVPDGVTIGEPSWPTPIRKVAPGDILDYIYEDEVTLLFPLVLSAGRSASESIQIEADVDWLVCSEACVPGSRTVKLTVPVSEELKPSSDAGLIAGARARVPGAQSDAPGPAVEWRVVEERLEVSCAGADKLTFFPYEGDLQPRDILDQGSVEGPRLRLTYGSAPAAGATLGVLEVVRQGRTTFHLIGGPGGSAVDQ